MSHTFTDKDTVTITDKVTAGSQLVSKKILIKMSESQTKAGNQKKFDNLKI